KSPFFFFFFRERCVIVRSFSKSCSITGFRVGYVAAPTAVIQAMSKLQSHLTGNVCTFAQEGALAALDLESSIVEQLRLDLQYKRDIAYQYARKMFKCIKPHGAFYLFPDVSGLLENNGSAKDLATMLLQDAGVAVVPGEAFGMQNHIRISYAVPEVALIAGFERIAEVI
ncbi:MAG: aminotransferase class I/II-fold pyridoxal phosphate-dependent enzyme, partial [Deltaproteobacteria bacterium]|nr:aminotransferase class I/II-fold pyridoxal phosphate-dependent enzyme [Deltaproteobacteria bacterium]